MNISNIRPDNPTIAIEGQATGETPVNVTPEGWTAPKRSNYDRIKSMTVEEMAEFLDLVRGNKNYPLYYTDWLDWLKEEAK